MDERYEDIMVGLNVVTSTIKAVMEGPVEGIDPYLPSKVEQALRIV